jgi:hypothetical protein
VLNLLGKWEVGIRDVRVSRRVASRVVRGRVHAWWWWDDGDDNMLGRLVAPERENHEDISTSCIWVVVGLVWSSI